MEPAADVEETIEKKERTPGEGINEASPDAWHLSGDALARQHYTPRWTLFMPEEGTCPKPLKHLDVMRETELTLMPKQRSRIEDIRTEEGAKEVSDQWCGRTKLYLLRPKPPKGYKWVFWAPYRNPGDNEA